MQAHSLDLGTKMGMQDGNLIIARTQDITPILENAKSRHNEGKHGSSDMKLAATIPFLIVEKYCGDNGILFSEFMQDPAHMRRILQDPALEHFRVWKGKL